MIIKAPSKSCNFFSILLVISFISCKLKREHTIPVYAGPKVVEAIGHIIPKDSIAITKLISAGKPKVVRAGKPKVILTNANEYLAGIPKIVKAGIPKVCTPGQDNFSIPENVPAADSQYIAGIPEVVIAGEAYTQDKGSHNFSSFGKLQGLKSNVIFSMLQDKNGNLWIGTQGQGVIKYDGKSFTQYSEKEGLAKFVRSILEDKNGNLWFGTWADGIIKYDGKRFSRFIGNGGPLNSTVRSMLEDKKGNLWFGTWADGVIKYDGMSFTHYTEKEGLSNNFVNCVLEDRHGNLWFGTNGGGVCRYNGKNFAHVTIQEGLSNNFVYSILEDKSGNLWFGTHGGGVTKYDGKSFAHFTELEGLNDNFVNSILEDKRGNLWFGTGRGVNKFDGRRFTQFAEKEGLSSDVIWTMLEDRNGNLWFGTSGGGVIKYDARRFTYLTEPEGLNLKSVTCILQDKSSNLWFGMRGAGVCKYDGKSFTHFTGREGLGGHTVWIIMEDKGGNLWFGTDAGVNKYDGKNFTHFTKKEGLVGEVKSMLVDKTGNIWFGAYQGHLIKYDGKNFYQYGSKEGLNLDNVNSILEDQSGNLWFGGYNIGVIKYDPIADWKGGDIMSDGASFTHFTVDQGLTHNDVRHIIEDKKGNLWFSTVGGGVSKYESSKPGRNAIFTHYTNNEGLSNNIVGSMMEDKSGNLWFGTANGLNKLIQEKRFFDANKSGLLFKTYSHEEGLSGIGINYGKTILEAKDGTFWICTENKVTSFYPNEETPDTIPPNIQLTGLALFNHYISWPYLEKNQDSSILLGKGDRIHGYSFNEVDKWYGLPQGLSLSYNNNHLTFRYVGIKLHSPKKVRYQYILQGFDNNWSDLTDRTEISYTNLSHGAYTFKVKAMNGEGYSSKELNYSFAIRPPWWLTWWFMTLSIVTFLGAIVMIMYWWFRHTYNQKLKVQMVRQKIAADLHDEIGSNLSSMTFAAELIKKKLNGSRQDIDPILNQLISSTQESSALISDTIWSLNSQNESFEKLLDHMKNFTHDLLSSKEISYTFDTMASAPIIALTLEQKRNINLIFKEAINNIAKHSKATAVIIQFHVLSEKLKIEIRDNGTGFDKNNITHGSGLNNFKLRSDPACEVQYSSGPGEGTMVQILALFQSDRISDLSESEKGSRNKSGT